MRGAVGSAEVDGAVNVALLELLLPNELKRELATIENLVLVVDDHTATIPWEALADRTSVSGVEPLVKRMGLVRQLQMQERHERAGPAIRPPGVRHRRPARRWGVQPARRRPPRGDRGRHPAHRGRPARRRHDLRTPTPTTTPAPPAAMVGRLLADDYQILHIAAHGWFEPARRHRPDAPAWGGVVIGPDQYLTAVEIGQMRRPPDLVFLNCCHLASVDGRLDGAVRPTRADMAFQVLHRPQLAASLSRTLMAMGVRAVVAAGWAVDDRAAAEFAKVFYDRLLDGESFGPAVRDARIAGHDSDRGSSNTWAAYQCYGDPGFRIRAPQPMPSTSSRPVSASELVRALDALAVTAGDSGADRTTIGEQVRALEDLATSPWDRRGDVWTALGNAYGECGQLVDAVRAYRSALTCDDTNAAARTGVPLQAVEQLANLEIRLAATLESSPPPDPSDVERLATNGSPPTPNELRTLAKTRIEALLALGRTAERLAISAGFWKRIAASTRGRTRAAAPATPPAPTSRCGSSTTSPTGRSTPSNSTGPADTSTTTTATPYSKPSRNPTSSNRPPTSGDASPPRPCPHPNPHSRHPRRPIRPRRARTGLHRRLLPTLHRSRTQLLHPAPHRTRSPHTRSRRRPSPHQAGRPPRSMDPWDCQEFRCNRRDLKVAAEARGLGRITPMTSSTTTASTSSPVGTVRTPRSVPLVGDVSRPGFVGEPPSEPGRFKAVRHRGHFPNEQAAALKVLYLVATERRPNRSNPTGPARSTPGRRS